MSKFRHFLSYGSTDQETARSLTGYFDGLIVPGTVAAFQAEGTKGFVLALSARSREPYAIDSRFPIFQSGPISWKKSHILLAVLFGFNEILQSRGSLRPDDFDGELVDRIARGWLDFNSGFEDVKLKTFDKYAARLPEDDISIEDRKSPEWVMPPYFMAEALDSPWLAASERIWDRSVELMKDRRSAPALRKVIAADSAGLWTQLLERTHETEVVGWVSKLDELGVSTAEVDQLVEYGQAISQATARGQRIFALYGGFFSVLLHRFGLTGSSHGVGYGEHRNHVELPSSGAPAARFYVPRLHRYIGVDIAATLWSEARDLVECLCPECEGRSPAALEYHELMRHSVRVRSAEIEYWTGRTTQDVCAALRYDFEDFRHSLYELPIPRAIRKRSEGIYLHLESWARALERIDEMPG